MFQLDYSTILHLVKSDCTSYTIVPHYLQKSFTFLASSIKHKTNETIKPTNESPSPNVTGEIADVKMIAIANSEIEIPKRDNRKTNPSIYHLNSF